MRSLLRSLAYAGGALRLRHAATLTVAMFHRVVPHGTPADPVYSLSPELFAACLAFFRRHYAVVSLADVLASQAGEATLPPRALLLTFDDGWRDTADFAAPLLRAAGMPGVVFAAADALADPGPWWQEVLLRALRERRASLAELWQAAGPAAPPEQPPELHLLLRYAALDAAVRGHLLARHLPGVAGAMLTLEALQALPAEMAIGGHGAAHVPLTLIDARADLARCRAMLGAGTVALSIPHGRYDAAVVAAAHAAGFTLLFTSDAYLNPVMHGQVGSLLGRISIQAEHIVGTDGHLDPARLATWLFHRGLGPAAPAGPGQGPGLA